jgi:hypothetical protein
VLVSGFTLHPIVGITDERPSSSPAAHEVEEVIEVSIEDLQDASNIRSGTRTREGVAIEYPYFDLRGSHVWGATAMILRASSSRFLGDRLDRVLRPRIACGALSTITIFAARLAETPRKSMMSFLCEILPVSAISVLVT